MKFKKIKPIKNKKSIFKSLWFKSLLITSSAALVVAGVSGITFVVTKSVISNQNHSSNQPNQGGNNPQNPNPLYPSTGDNPGDNNPVTPSTGDNPGDNNPATPSTGDNPGDDSGQSGTNNDYQTGLNYNTSSEAAYWISERTMSLMFMNSSSATLGTGWIYEADQSTNTYYVATNLHVAGALSFAGNSNLTISNNDGTYNTSSYGSVSTFVGIALGLTEQTNNYSNSIVYFPVTNPEVVYTTTSNSNFNNLFNTSTSTTSSSTTGSLSRNYYGLGIDNKEDKFYGAVDIAILKFVINPNSLSTSSNIFLNSNNSISSYLSSTQKEEYITTFKNWLQNYFSNPTKIYTDYVNDLQNLDSQKIYMAGFPSYSLTTHGTGSQLSDIKWLAFSDFTIATTLQESNGTSLDAFDELNYPGNDDINQTNYASNYPISFYNGNSSSSTTSSESYTDYNFLSIGVLSYLNASSFSGSSGSPIVIQDSNGDFEVAGIYWGGLTASLDNSETFQKGLMTWFATNSYKLGTNVISYNLTSYIVEAIKDTTT